LNSFVKEQADSTRSSSLYGSKRNSLQNSISRDEPLTPRHRGSDSELSTTSIGGASPQTRAVIESPQSKPRLVGFRQPFFATSPPLEQENNQLEAMERVKAQAASNNTKVRVLVAEDNKVNQEVVLRMLKLEDIYDVTVAKDGQEAFDMVKKSMEENKLFNLIFMDVQMPNLDGLQSTRLIRGVGYQAPIVALTAFAEESNVQECMESGMNFFLPKPIRRPALKQVLKRYCATIPESDEPESPPLGKKNGQLTDPPSNSNDPEIGNSAQHENITSSDPTPIDTKSEGISPMSQ
jgi:osomolarity two-component system, sensor histidine kinase SLN1